VYGPFPVSLAVTDSRDVRLVPTPGHSPAHVAVVFSNGDGPTLFFGGDHLIRPEWFVEDVARGRFAGSIHYYSPKLAVETSKRVAQFVRDVPTVLIASHDESAHACLEASEPIKVPA
jgi:glyoxylase-like metal-dependent hydrolase (beta-lactamase superfamily II)